MWIQIRRPSSSSCRPRPSVRSGVRRGRRGGPGLLVALVLVLGACSTQGVPERRDVMGDMGPVLSVERFLQAANANELDAMARLFGTVDGPMRGDRQDIELRMDAIARILQHEDYRIVAQRQEPGREHPTTRITVELVKENRRIPDVPFLVVRTSDGGWLVEEIGLERVTGG